MKIRKVIITFSKLILALFIVNIFAGVIYHVSTGGTMFGALTKPILAFAKFPQTVKEVYSQIESKPPYYIFADTTFEPINRLENDIYALNATSGQGYYTYKLYNLKNDSVIYSWKFSRENFVGTPERFAVAHPQNPVLLSDSSIIGMFYETPNLFRLDKNSNLVWINNDIIFHHSLNLSHDNYVWACGWSDSYTKNSHSNSVTKFQDDILLKVDIETGEIVFKKSLAKILIENGYQNIVHGYGNEATPKGKDLFHLNDIQPITVDGEYWQKGDLLLSLRHRSMIVQYRPETNKIIRLISGPFLSQHDVDVLSENEISIFNNNRTVTVVDGNVDSIAFSSIDLKSSNIVVYNLSDSTFSFPSLEVFENEKMFTSRQGLHEFLENGDLFVESTEEGKIFVIRGNDIIFKRYANEVDEDGYTEYPHWMRIFEKNPFLK